MAVFLLINISKGHLLYQPIQPIQAFVSPIRRNSLKHTILFQALYEAIPIAKGVPVPWRKSQPPQTACCIRSEDAFGEGRYKWIPVSTPACHWARQMGRGSEESTLDFRYFFCLFLDEVELTWEVAVTRFVVGGILLQRWTFNIGRGWNSFRG